MHGAPSNNGGKCRHLYLHMFGTCYDGNIMHAWHGGCCRRMHQPLNPHQALQLHPQMHEQHLQLSMQDVRHKPATLAGCLAKSRTAKHSWMSSCRSLAWMHSCKPQTACCSVPRMLLRRQSRQQLSSEPSVRACSCLCRQKQRSRLRRFVARQLV